MLRRSGLLAFIVLALAVSTLPGFSWAQESRPGGQLALPRGADLLIVDVETAAERLLTLEGDALVSSVAWAPGRDRLAVARSSRPPGDNAFGQDIEVLDAGSGEPRSVIKRDTSGIILDMPVWTADGSWLLFDRQETIRFGVTYRIERARPDGTERSIVVENARSPSLSPDGSLLAFVRGDQGEVLYVSGPEGQDARPIVPAGRYLLISYPRFSPDGQWLAFATVTDPTRVAPTTPPAPGGVMQAIGLLGGDLSAPRRHGIPWDIWLVRTDGTDLRVARIAEDDPSIAWAPDGSVIAVYGGRGLGLMDRSGEIRPLLSEIIGFGGIDWVR